MKDIYRRENIGRAITGLATEGETLRERVAAGYRYLLRSEYAGTQAEATVESILEITKKVDHGDWSKVSDAEIREIVEHIIELALNRDEWIPLKS